MEFKDRLKELMEEKNMSVKGISKESGVSVNTIVSYLNGERKPRFAQLIALWQCFQVSMDYFMCFSENKQVEPKHTRPHI